MLTISKKSFLFLVCFPFLFGLFGCGSDDGNPSENLVGTYELLTIDGKTLKEDLEADIEDGEVLAVTAKLVFSADGSLYQEVEMSIVLIDPEIPDFSFDFKFKVTASGKYVVSDTSLEFISGDQVNIATDLSINTGETPVDPELEQLVEQLEETLTQEFETELKEEFRLELTTYTWRLEDNLLTLHSGSEEVWRKK